MERHCVTVKEFGEFLATGYLYPQSLWCKQNDYPEYPVRWVSALDADAYCAWKRVRLPTEVEWIAKMVDCCPSGLWEWTNTSQGTSRVLRGGFWNFDPDNVCADFRDYNHPDYRDYSISFRVVKENQ